MDYRISDIVNTAINNIGHIAEVNTIVGQPIIAPDGTTIMPVSQLTFAFMAGGGEYGDKINKSIMKDDYIGHFAGGSGGGATLTPVSFLIVGKEGVKVLKASEEGPLEKLFDVAKGMFGDKN